VGVVVLSNGRKYQASSAEKTIMARMYTNLPFTFSSCITCRAHTEATNHAWQVIGQSVLIAVQPAPSPPSRLASRASTRTAAPCEAAVLTGSVSQRTEAVHEANGPKFSKKCVNALVADGEISEAEVARRAASLRVVLSLRPATKYL
jgi:hypothetical protein